MHVKSFRQSNRLIYQSKETLKYPQAVTLTKAYLGDCSHNSTPYLPSFLPQNSREDGRNNIIGFAF